MPNITGPWWSACVFKMAIRWIGLGGCQSCVKPKQGRAVRAEHRRLHGEIDMGVVVWWQRADAVEFAHTDANLTYRKLIVELQKRGHRIMRCQTTRLGTLA